MSAEIVWNIVNPKPINAARHSRRQCYQNKTESRREKEREREDVKEPIITLFIQYMY